MNHNLVIVALAVLEVALIAVLFILEYRRAKRHAEELRILRRILVLIMSIAMRSNSADRWQHSHGA